MGNFDLQADYIDDNAELARSKVTEALQLLRSVAVCANHAVVNNKNLLSAANDEDILQTIGEMEDSFELLLELLGD
jgi:hypothetical protein